MLAHQDDDDLTQYTSIVSRSGVTEDNLNHVAGICNVLVDCTSYVSTPVAGSQPGGGVLQKRLMLAQPRHTAALTMLQPITAAANNAANYCSSAIEISLASLNPCFVTPSCLIFKGLN